MWSWKGIVKAGEVGDSPRGARGSAGAEDARGLARELHLRGASGRALLNGQAFSWTSTLELEIISLGPGLALKSGARGCVWLQCRLRLTILFIIIYYILYYILY